MKILVVEDDEDSRICLEKILKSQNYTVESAANGVLALEKALLSPPDMIISDILMPEMDGFDLCRKVKANEKLQHIPFIFYTATFIDKKDEELALSLGASRFIVKPFKMEELFKIIIDVTEEHKEKKQPVPEKTLVEIEKIDEMYSGTIARKLDKKVAQLQKEITEHKQTEETLRQSEEKFSKAFNSTPDAIEITRVSDERLIEVNEVFVRRSGYSRDEVIGHTTLEFNLWANPQDRERYFTTMREQGSVREQESQFRMKSGEMLYALVSGETFSMGEEKYIQTIIRDITKRKQAEDGLRESESRYRGLHESMADCFIQVAMSGEIVDVNRSYLEMLGYTEEEVKLRYKDITPAKWREFEQKIVDTQIIARGYSDVYEKEYIRKDGTVFPVELRTYLLRSKDGKPFGMWTIIRDITERKLAVEKLRETSVYTRSLIEASLDPLVMISPQGKITDVNKATELTIGLPREKLIGSDFSDYFTEPEKARAVYQQVFDKELVTDYPLVIRHISGSTRDVLYNASVYRDSAGNVAGVFAVARDITQRKQAEDALRESEARYRMLFESMTDCFVHVAMSGEIVDVNHAFLEMLGYTKEEALKLRYQDITPAKWHEGQKVYETQVMTRGYSDVYEKEYIRKDGTVFPVELKKFLLRDTDGNPSSMWAIVRDITERKRAEEALRKSEKSLKKAQELGKIGNWEFDLKTQKINWSDEVYVLYERDKKLGPPTVEEEAKYYTPEVAEKLHEFTCLATETSKEYRYDFSIRLPNGRTAFFNSSIYPVIDEKGNVIQLWGTVQDITERKREEEERIQLLAREHAALAEAEAARKLDHLKSMFIASTSHELRTPLNSIIGFSRMLLEGYSGELNPEQQKQLDIVNSAGKHLLSLISDVIDVSRIEAGKIELEVSEVELRQVVDEAVSTLGASIKEKGIILSVEVEDITVKTDKKRLLQCILNLIGNAVKYTEKGNIKITAKTTGNRIEISVNDTGIGIEKEDIPKLFAPFVRLQTPLTEKTTGTGLGLYLVKKLAKDFLGGDVGVESEFGKGSKFTLNIPIEFEGKG